MDVWLVHTGEPLPEGGRGMHAATLATALAARGHRVLWWVGAFDHFPKQWLFHEDKKFSISTGLTGYAVKGCGYPSNTSARRFVDHRIVACKWRKLAAAEPPPDAIVVAMPPHDLAFEAVRFAADRGIPTVLNVRDPWPDAIIDLAPPILRPFARRILWRDFGMLRAAVTRADSVVSVTGSLLDWADNHAGRPRQARDRVIYTGARRCPGTNPSHEMRTLLASLGDQFVVAFIGTFGFYHAPTIAVECARKLTDTNVHFVLGGAGEGLSELKRKAEGLPNLHFPGWLSEDDSAELLRFAKVGICTPTRSIAILPNKAATYLRAGLPIVSAFDGDLKRLIDERDVGFNYPVGNVEVFAECITRLACDETLRKRMSDNARGLYEELFDAEANIELFADHIESIAT